MNIKVAKKIAISALAVMVCALLLIIPVTVLADDADPYEGYTVYKAEEGWEVDGKALSFKDDVSFYYGGNNKSYYSGYNKVDNPDTRLTEVYVIDNSGTVIGENAVVAHFGDTSGVQVRSTFPTKTSVPTSTLLFPWQIEENEEFVFSANIKINQISDTNRWMALTVGNKLNDAEQLIQHYQLVIRMNGTVGGITKAVTDPGASTFAWTNYTHNNGSQSPIDTVSALTAGNTYTLKIVGENKTVNGEEVYVLSSYIGDAVIMKDYVIAADQVAGYLGIEVNGIDVEIDFDDTTKSKRDITGYNQYNLNGRDDYRSILQQYELANNVYSKVEANSAIAFGKTGFTVSGGSGATQLILPWQTAADEDFVYTGTFKVLSGEGNNYMALSFANSIDGENDVLSKFLHANMRVKGSNAGMSYFANGNGWQDLINEGRALSPLTVGETYTFELVITDGHIMDYYINDVAIIRDFDLETFKEHKTGVITNAAGNLGINIKNMVLDMDYTDYGEYKQSGYGAEEYTVNSPAAVIWNSDSTILDVLNGSNLPSHVALNIDKDMNVTAIDGFSVNKSLIDLCELILKKNAIPLIRIDDMEEATALTDYLNDAPLRDAMVVSTDIDALYYVLSNTSGVRGIYDLSSETKTYTKEELSSLMTTANSHEVKIILLSDESADRESVYWLQTRLMTVWASVNGNSLIENYRTLTNGVDGVFTNNFVNIKNALKSFSGTNVLLRVPTICGHRGSKVGADGSIIPEVTVDALLQASAFGANAVECDIQPTKDGVLVIHHDDTTNRMMQQNVTIVDTNYDDLKDILYKEEYSKDKDGNYVPRTIDTLEDQFAAFADVPNTVFYIEIKAIDTELEESVVTELRRLAYKYNVVNRCVVITFDTGVMEAMHKIFPEVSLGYLKNDFTQSVNSVINAVESVNATVNPRYYQAPTDAYGLYLRGVTIHPWTLNGTTLDKYFVTGIFQSLSTDDTIKIGNWASYIALESDTVNVESGKTINFGASVINKIGNAIEGATLTPVKISGNDLLLADDGSYYLCEGSSVIMLKYEATTDGGEAYTIYSNPITVNATGGHVYATETENKEATCTENGYVVKACKCGATERTTLYAPGHTEAVDAAVAPTCTETGLTEGKHCSVCNEVLVAQESVDALGHDWTDATTEASKTCKTCGETEGEKLPTPVEPPCVMPSDDHSECEANWFVELWNAIVNFFRRLFGLPEQCVCGKEL